MEQKKIADNAIITSNEVLQVKVGEKNSLEVFHVHRDLLSLYTWMEPTYFPRPMIIPGISGVQYAHFMSWMYNGNVREDLPGTVEDLWAAAIALEAPRFQNHCTDLLRMIARERFNARHKNLVLYPNCDQATAAYTLSKKGSRLRLFVADCVAFTALQFDDYMLRDSKWVALFRANADLRLDVLKASEMDWNGTKPWDTDLRDRYVNKVCPLKDEWKRILHLKSQMPQGIEDAKNGHIRALITNSMLGEEVEEE